MRNTFIASVLSIALAATSVTATPARADEDVAKIIAGLALLGIIAGVSKKDRRHDPAPVMRRSPRHDPAPVAGGGHRYKDVSRDRRRAAKIAPRQCLRNQWTHRGERSVYSARCLQRSVRATLPQNCLREARRTNGPRYFYTKRCLKGHGWRL